MRRGNAHIGKLSYRNELPTLCPGMGLYDESSDGGGRSRNIGCLVRYSLQVQHSGGRHVNKLHPNLRMFLARHERPSDQPIATKYFSKLRNGVGRDQARTG